MGEDMKVERTVASAADIANPPETALANAKMKGRGLWVTWEHQRRNHGIAQALGVPLLELDIKETPVLRYAISLWRTLRALGAHRPDVLFAQNPSLVLALLSVVWGRCTQTLVVVDAHNAAIAPLTAGRRGLLPFLARFIIRRASLTIVTNRRLADAVIAEGGRPAVLPDRIPVFAPRPLMERSGRTVLFVCTFAADEPYMEVLEAAKRIDHDITIYVTGNPGRLMETVRAAAPANVVFTGFVPENDYVDYLHRVDVVMDLTSRDDCLVCGAYEAVAALKPMVLSGSQVTRDYFSEGAVFTDNSVASLKEAIEEALKRNSELRSQVEALRNRLVSDWRGHLSRLVSSVHSSRSRLR